MHEFSFEIQQFIINNLNLIPEKKIKKKITQSNVSTKTMCLQLFEIRLDVCYRGQDSNPLNLQIFLGKGLQAFRRLI